MGESSGELWFHKPCELFLGITNPISFHESDAPYSYSPLVSSSPSARSQWLNKEQNNAIFRIFIYRRGSTKNKRTVPEEYWHQDVHIPLGKCQSLPHTSRLNFFRTCSRHNELIINTEHFPALFPLGYPPAGFFQLIFTPAHVNWHYPFLSHHSSCGSSCSTTSNFSDLCPGFVLQWAKFGTSTKARLQVMETRENETKRTKRLGTEPFARPKYLYCYIKLSHPQESAVL